jgi:hypothetical protein
LVALDAREFAADGGGASRLALRPRPLDPRRIVADMLVVPARELGHPVADVVAMEAYDRLAHEGRIERISAIALP